MQPMINTFTINLSQMITDDDGLIQDALHPPMDTSRFCDMSIGHQSNFTEHHSCVHMRPSQMISMTDMLPSHSVEI